MKPSSAKAKGRKLQQWACEQISKLTGCAWGPDEQIASREMGQAGVDIRLIADAAKAFPWSVECKCCESWRLPDWIQQAQKNRLPGTDWLLICKRNRQAPVVVLDAETFFQVLDRLPGNRKGR